MILYDKGLMINISFSEDTNTNRYILLDILALFLSRYLYSTDFAFLVAQACFIHASFCHDYVKPCLVVSP